MAQLILQKRFKLMNNSKCLKVLHLVRTGQLESPGNFIQSVPHMSFVKGENNVRFLRSRVDSLKERSFEKMKSLKILKRLRMGTAYDGRTSIEEPIAIT